MGGDKLHGRESTQHHQIFDHPKKLIWVHSSGKFFVRDLPLNIQNWKEVISQVVFHQPGDVEAQEMEKRMPKGRAAGHPELHQFLYCPDANRDTTVDALDC